MWIGNQIEIPEINLDTKLITLLVHVKEYPTEERLHKLKQNSLRYLLNEGFLPENYDGWQCLSGVVLHESKN